MLRLVEVAAITCAKCGARRVFRGSKWEVVVATEVWQRQHERTEHEGENARLSRPDREPY